MYIHIHSVHNLSTYSTLWHAALFEAVLLVWYNVMHAVCFVWFSLISFQCILKYTSCCVCTLRWFMTPLWLFHIRFSLNLQNITVCTAYLRHACSKRYSVCKHCKARRSRPHFLQEIFLHASVKYLIHKYFTPCH